MTFGQFFMFHVFSSLHGNPVRVSHSVAKKDVWVTIKFNLMVTHTSFWSFNRWRVGRDCKPTVFYENEFFLKVLFIDDKHDLIH